MTTTSHVLARHLRAGDVITGLGIVVECATVTANGNVYVWPLDGGHAVTWQADDPVTIAARATWAEGDCADCERPRTLNADGLCVTCASERAEAEPFPTITARCAVCGEDVREIPAHLYTGGEELCDDHAREYGSL